MLDPPNIHATNSHLCTSDVFGGDGGRKTCCCSEHKNAEATCACVFSNTCGVRFCVWTISLIRFLLSHAAFVHVGTTAINAYIIFEYIHFDFVLRVWYLSCGADSWTGVQHTCRRVSAHRSHPHTHIGYVCVREGVCVCMWVCVSNKLRITLRADGGRISRVA